MTKSVNKIVILLVALLMCVTVVFAACNKDEFKPVSKPKSGEVLGNGGIAVVYGEWLYYVNGYTSDVSADNTYSDSVKTAPRTGSVVRIRLSDIEKLFAINDDKDLTSSSAKAEAIASAVRAGDKDREIKGAETVVPKVYYSGNSTTTQFTGIHIFNNRIYVTTPSDELTANGDPMTEQLQLMSFDLGGGDRKVHYTFTSNSAQIWLTEVNKKVVATYLMENVLHTLDVASGKDTVVTLDYSSKLKHINNTVSGVNWDVTGSDNDAVFFVDEFGSICKLQAGSKKYVVLLENDTYKLHNHDGNKEIEAGDKVYTVKFVNNGTVYYTLKNGKNDPAADTILYQVSSETDSGEVALPTSSLSLKVWKDNKFVTTDSYKSGEKTFYSICIVDGTTYEKTPLLEYGENDSTITINKIEGDNLYYTANSISYVLNLEEVEKKVAEQGKPIDSGTALAKNLASSNGWAAPDYIDFTLKVDDVDTDFHYVISLSSGTVTLTKFNPEDLKANAVSIALTLTAKPTK